MAKAGKVILVPGTRTLAQSWAMAPAAAQGPTRPGETPALADGKDAPRVLYGQTAEGLLIYATLAQSG